MAKQFLCTDDRTKRILSVGFVREPEDCPDLSWLGEYTSQPGPEDKTIDRKERGEQGRGEYRYFVAANSGAETGNPDSVEQDYQRMESMNRGVWEMLYCQACAVVSINGVQQRVNSGGLGGAESDSDASYFAEIRAEQFGELRDILKSMGFKTRTINKAIQEAE